MTINKSEKDIFLAIDANAIIHRAFHAYPPTLQTQEGLQVNAVYGFTTMLIQALEMFDPKYVLCAMDTAKPTFRHEMYTEYKATRKPTDLSLIDQFPLVEEVLKSFNIPILKREGYEADDILGTVSKYVSEGTWSSNGLDLYILSGDKDLLQLITDNVHICLPNGNFKNIVVYDRENTYSKYGFYPEQVVDYKAIVGDASDNIPGIKGIGDKTALTLLNKYGTLNGIYEHINEVPERYRKLFVEGVEQAEFSRQLASIDKNVEIDTRIMDCLLVDFDRRQLVSTFKKYAFKSLLNKLDDLFGVEEQQTNFAQLDMFNGDSNEYEWMDEEVVVEDLKTASELRVIYIDNEESFNNEPFFFIRAINKDKKIKDILCKPFDILQYISVTTIFYNFEELVTLSDCSVEQEYPGFTDVVLLEHLLSSEKRNVKIKDLAFDYSTKVLSDRISPNQMLLVLDVLEDTYFAQEEKVKNLELYSYTKDSINRYLGGDENLLLQSLRKVELPTSVILSKMEKRGISIDLDKLEKLKLDIQEEIKKTSKEIFSIVGHEFNVNSPKQLSDVLYKELGLPGTSKNSTRETVLTEMVGLHPIIEHLLYFREISKVESTYVKPLIENSRKDNGGVYAIHTDFKQTGTTSGRFSSVNPNMQNLPLDGDWAKRVRECFVAREGFKLLGMDYSQMELRIMADISNDKLLIGDFNKDIDAHSATAARVLGKKVKDITSKERRLGKIVNFGMIFGQTQFGLSRLLKIDKEVAAKYINAYFEHYSGVEQYMRNIEREAYEKGYVQTMFGTTRHISGIKSRNKRLQSAAAREAINMPIQGSEADIMKLVMIKVFDLINRKYSDTAYMLLQVHDEIIFEVEESILEEFSKEARDILLKSVELEVPFDVHVSSGKRLSELK